MDAPQQRRTSQGQQHHRRIQVRRCNQRRERIRRPTGDRICRRGRSGAANRAQPEGPLRFTPVQRRLHEIVGIAAQLVADVHRGRTGVSQARARTRRQLLAMKQDWPYRLEELADAWFNPSDGETVGLPDAVFFLYPLLRPFAWIARKSGK